MRLFFLLICIGLSLFFLTACAGTNTPIEEARYRLEKYKEVYVNSAQIASELVGFTVKTPSFIPDGFAPYDNPGGSYRLTNLEDPEGTVFFEFQYEVLERFFVNGKMDENVTHFSIIQSQNQIRGQGEDPVSINGFNGMKGTKTIDDKKTLWLSWNDGVVYYVLVGSLADELPEETLIKIAASLQ
jgi:hypothetical protein